MGAAAPALYAMGTALAAYGQYSTANAQRAAAQFNRRAALRARQDAIARGQVEEARSRMQVNQAIGTQRALMGGSGVAVGSGSPLVLVQDSRQVGELEARTIRNNAFREAWGYEVQSSSYAFEEAAARKRRFLQPLGTALAGGATALNAYRR